MKQIVIVLASSNANKKLAHSLINELEIRGAENDLISLVDFELPMYTSAYEEDWGVPEAIQELHARLKRADGIVFVSPEYNGGIPPILSNMIAWISRLNDDWRQAFNGKPAAMATHSGSSGNTLMNALRCQLSYLGMNVLGRQIITTPSKPLSPTSKTAVVEMLLKYAGA